MGHRAAGAGGPARARWGSAARCPETRGFAALGTLGGGAGRPVVTLAPPQPLDLLTTHASCLPSPNPPAHPCSPKVSSTLYCFPSPWQRCRSRAWCGGEGPDQTFWLPMMMGWEWEMR